MKLPAFPARRSVKALLASATAALVLAACGGGTSAINDFVAARVIAFGDELSVLTADGRKYGVNQLDEDDAVDCATQPIWVQTVAAVYELVFAECNPEDVDETNALMRAAPGARVADLEAQIDAEAAAGIPADTLATVLVGMHDLLDLYADYPTTDQAALLAAARARGEALAAQVNRLVNLGARVIISTVPDQGLTPFALAEKEAHDDIDRARLLSDLSTEFNAGLRTKMLNDGRSVGLVLADEMVQAMAKVPGAFGLSNVIAAACLETAVLPDCTTDTLVENADPATWLWADATRMAFNAQNRLGLLAAARARDNPF